MITFSKRKQKKNAHTFGETASERAESTEHFIFRWFDCSVVVVSRVRFVHSFRHATFLFSNNKRFVPLSLSSSYSKSFFICIAHHDRPPYSKLQTACVLNLIFVRFCRLYFRRGSLLFFVVRLIIDNKSLSLLPFILMWTESKPVRYSLFVYRGTKWQFIAKISLITAVFYFHEQFNNCSKTTTTKTTTMMMTNAAWKVRTKLNYLKVQVALPNKIHCM